MDFTKEDLLRAIEKIDENPELRVGRNSSTYDLLYNEKKYPPILVLSLANQLNNGKEILLKDFNEGTKEPFKILRNLGFEIRSKVTNLKTEYNLWAIENLTVEDTTKKQYVTNLENLSEIIGYKIFETDSIKKIEALYYDLLKEQKIKNGKYYSENRPSASLKGWYSAAVKTYMDFLKSVQMGDAMQITGKSLLFDKAEFINSLRSSGLIFDPRLVNRFLASLLTKPFVILTGLSGSGKTKLAQSFVQWICADQKQYKIIPVGADWTNREPLLGYPNALKPEEYVKPDSGVLDLIIEASDNPELPYFLILDEMNLSHVERYFADFLSVMESKEHIPLHAEDTIENGVPTRLKIPVNLFIIGTVNIDETTNMFSPKVLDRANTIEFRVTQEEMKSFLGNIKDIKMHALMYQGADMAKSFLKIAEQKEFAPADTDVITTTLVRFFGELKKTGAEFGYRSATEIMRLINQLTVLDDTLKSNDKIDIAIMQKLLPKLHGSRRKLCPVLETLGSFCVTGEVKIIKDVFDNADFNFKDENILFPLSLEKISRMYRGAIDNGFASFAEA